MTRDPEWRADPREPFVGRLTLEAGEDGPIEAGAVDLGRGGIGLVAPRELPPGRPVVVAFRASSAGAERHVPGRVAHSRAYFDGYRMGVAFDRPLSDSVHAGP
jgi:hypothetical protein